MAEHLVRGPKEGAVPERIQVPCPRCGKDLLERGFVGLPVTADGVILWPDPSKPIMAMLPARCHHCGRYLMQKVELSPVLRLT